MLGGLKAAHEADPFGLASILDRRLTAHDPAPIAVALSGGGDSLALLHLTAAWAAGRGRAVLALTVDHRLSPDSARWTQDARAMAQAAGAEWRGLAWTGLKPPTGVPAAARAARHALVAQAARGAGARVVLMAHTADDAAENAAMRADDAPGIGRLRAWGPSPVWPEGRGVALLRPLLGTRRAELRAWLIQRSLRWIDDPANENASHPRIRARRALVTAGRVTVDDAPQTAPLFEADDAGVVRASRATLTHAPSAAVMGQLAAALASAGGTAGPVRGRVCADLLGRMRGGGEVRANAGGASLVARGGAVTLTPEQPRAGARPHPDPLAVRPRLDLAIGRTVCEAQLA